MLGAHNVKRLSVSLFFTVALLAGFNSAPVGATSSNMTNQQESQQKVEQTGSSQEARPADVASVESIVAALYDVISGPAGQKRDWNRMRSLFIPEGRLMAVSPKKEGGYRYLSMDVEGYIKASGNYLETNGFFEREIARTVEKYGQIAHVFSTYEARNKSEDPKHFMRGINSIQLLNDGKRWWIVSVYWQAEGTQNPLPEKYMKSRTD